MCCYFRLPWKVACDRCEKWRRVTREVFDAGQREGSQWFCEMNTDDPRRSNCQAEEQAEDYEEVAYELANEESVEDASPVGVFSRCILLLESAFSVAEVSLSLL